ncbi:MAG: hypothetical protein ABSF50_03105 [Burkholderiaceae bacterium]
MTVLESEAPEGGEKNARRVHQSSQGALIAAPFLLVLGVVWMEFRYFYCAEKPFGSDGLAASLTCENSFALPALFFVAILFFMLVQGRAVHRHGTASLKARRLRAAERGPTAAPARKERFALHEGYLTLPPSHQAKVRRTVTLTLCAIAGALAAVIFRYDEHPELPNAIVLLTGAIGAVAVHVFLWWVARASRSS